MLILRTLEHYVVNRLMHNVYSIYIQQCLTSRVELNRKKLHILGGFFSNSDRIEAK